MTEEEKKLYFKEYRVKHQKEINARQKAYRKEHQEEFNAYQRAYYAEHREEINAKRKQHRTEHKEEFNAKVRQYHAEHREEINAYHRAYYAEHRNRIKANNARRIVNYATLANTLIDYLCERDGIRETIGLLFDAGCTKEELIEMQFVEDDIEKAIAE